MPSIIKNGVNYTNSELLSTLSDTNISSPANGEALVYDSVNQKWVNGEAGGKVWQGTQAQYDAITNPDPDTTYFITDGQQVTANMWEGTAAEYAQITDPDPGTFYFIKDGESVSCNLGELNDVNVSGATQGQVLTKGASSWEATTLNIPTIAVRSVSDTTDNTGYFMVAFPSNVIVFTAWAQQGDCIVSFFPSQGADEHGRINWWFRIMNQSMQPRTSAPITLYIMYTTH